MKKVDKLLCKDWVIVLVLFASMVMIGLNVYCYENSQKKSDAATSDSTHNINF